MVQKDFFKQVVIAGIKGADSNQQKRMLIASIPFYRNLAEYSGEDNDYLKLTCFLHYKATPIDTASVTLEKSNISLENKLIVSIAARLQAEKYLKQVIIAHEGHCPDSESNQMRAWYEKAKPYLSSEEKAIFDEINLITPEAIHLNAFMYEPLIDVSIWALTDLYSKTVHLGQAVTNNGYN